MNISNIWEEFEVQLSGKLLMVIIKIVEFFFFDKMINNDKYLNRHSEKWQVMPLI